MTLTARRSEYRHANVILPVMTLTASRNNFLHKNVIPMT